MTHPRTNHTKTVALGAAVAPLCVWCVSYYIDLAQSMFTTLHMNDFGRFYYAAQAWLDGGDLYGETLATGFDFAPGVFVQLPNLNPPHFHLLMLPFARLSPIMAIIAWAAVSVAALVWSLVVIAREIGMRWTPLRVMWTGVAALMWSATGTNLVTGQVGFLMMLPATLAWAAARNHRWVRAGIYLGVAASAKPFLLLFLPFLFVTRRWSSALAMVAGGGACVALGIAVFGWPMYVEWARVLIGVNWGSGAMNGSLPGLLNRALTDNLMFASIIQAPMRTVAMIGLMVSGVVAVAALMIVAPPRDRDDTDRSFAIVALTCLLASPLGWIYYVGIALGPLAALRQQHRLHTTMWLALPGVFCPVFATTLWPGSVLATVTIGSIYMWTIVVCLVGAVRASRA